MAKILGLCGSQRRHGYTATMLKEALQAASEVEGVEVELVYLHEMDINPCTSCFYCVKNPNCHLKDEMGGKGEGDLWKKMYEANAIIFSDSVHNFGPTSQFHLWSERCYPLVWNNELQGLPVAAISVASNQGMHHLALKDMCKSLYAKRFRYVWGVPVHTAYFEEAKNDVHYLGRLMAEKALEDEQGRVRFESDEAKWLYYMDKPFRPYDAYLEQMTNGKYTLQDSLVVECIAQKRFKNPEAIEYLYKSRDELERAIYYYKVSQLEDSCRYLVRASAYWAHATWKEFLEEKVIRREIPEDYRPLDFESIESLQEVIYSEESSKF